MKSYEHIIVAVHGIGAQSRNATVRSVATRLARSTGLAVPGIRPLSPQPLGYFHTDVRGAVKVAPLDRFPTNGHLLGGIGVTEVFWADIPQEVMEEKRTLEETKAWARTLVARARAVFDKGWDQLTPTEKQRVRRPDFGQAGEVLEEIIDTLQVLENLCFLLDKAGVLKVNLREVLDEYLGDVQLVTEFEHYRQNIIARFHDAVEKIHEKYPEARLHIVAHSEGTVVSFLGLLHAMSGQQFSQTNKSGTPSAAAPKWLKQVYGYMTIGSPIDKHILLWPELFGSFHLESSKKLFEERAQEQALKKPGAEPDRGIEWRNYYDFGDPIGFELDTTRHWLAEQEFNPFHFKQEDREGGLKHDIGFSRYVLPGKAHNDYWEDADVFEHFVRDVVRRDPLHPATAPQNRKCVKLLSTTLPYVLSFLVLFGGVLLLYRAVSQHMNPPLDPLQNYVRYMTLGLAPEPGSSGWHLVASSLAVSALVAGTTLLSRFPRLVRTWKWFGCGVLAFAIGAFAYCCVLDGGSADAIGAALSGFPIMGAKGGTIALALLIGVIGLCAIPKNPSLRMRDPKPASAGVAEQPVPPRYKSRRTRWLFKGMRPLIVSGALAMALLIGVQLRERDGEEVLSIEQQNQVLQSYLGTNNLAAIPKDSPAWVAAVRRLEQTQKLIKPHPPVWPIILSGVAFLYVWWLAALIFDLAFVWHRYIRDSDPMHQFRQCARLSKAQTQPAAASAS
ncbi:MAG TPA: hypothetical protein VK530_09910 [Candidatus Acidoferrum sp.]|nr:hypothetical protein [Candidatus Acidoferrum sp.]